MGGCECTIQSKPLQQEDAPAVMAAKAPTWDSPAVVVSDEQPIFDARLPRSDTVLSIRDRGPPKEPDISGNRLRAPPSLRA